jgi:hypothetical protein
MKQFIINKLSNLIYRTHFVNYCQQIVTFIQCNMGYIAALIAYYC